MADMSMSLDEARKLSTSGGGAEEPRQEVKLYSPNPDAPSVGYITPKQNPTEYQSDSISLAQARSPEGIPASKRGDGIARNYAAGANETIRDTLASILGLPAEAAAGIAAPRYWNSLPDDKKQEFRDANPLQSKFMDFLDEATKNPALGKKFWQDTIEGAYKSIPKAKVAGVQMGPIETDEVKAVSLGERASRAAGGGTADMTLMGGGAGMLSRQWAAGEKMIADTVKSFTTSGRSINVGATKAGEDMLKGTLASADKPITISTMLKGDGMGSNARMGAAAGAIGEIAQDKAPDFAKPTVRAMGELVGGGASALLDAGASSVRGVVGRATEKPEMRNARKIIASAEDEEKFRANIANEAGTESPVPGVEKTTATAGEDLGVGNLEKNLRTDERAAPKFQRRAMDNNAARREALDKIANDGAPEDFTDYIKARIGEILGYHDARVKSATNTVGEDIEAIGGSRRDHSVYGDAMRPKLKEIAVQEREDMQEFWNALKQDRHVPVNVSPLDRLAGRLKKEMTGSDKPIAGEERDIFGVITRYKGETSFGDLVSLRSRISNEMDLAKGSSIHRLSELLKGVDDTLAYKAGDIAKDPVARARMFKELSEEATRWEADQARRGFDVNGEPIKKSAAGGLSGEADLGPQVGTIGEGSLPPPLGGQGPRGVPAGSPPGVAGVQEARDVLKNFAIKSDEDGWTSILTKEQAQTAPVVYAPARDGAAPDGLTNVYRSRDAATKAGGGEPPLEYRLKEGTKVYADLGGENNKMARVSLLKGDRNKATGIVHVDDLEPHWGRDKGLPQDVKQRYQDARDATRDYKGTFAENAVGRVLKRGINDEGFNTSSSNVAQGLFDKPENFKSFMDAASKGGEKLDKVRASLMDDMEDYAAFSFRRAATKDGLVSEGNYAKWMRDHAHALDEFPELKAKFETAKKAQATLDEVSTAQAQAIKDHQSKAFALVTKGEQPRVVVARTIENPDEFDKLVMKVGPDPAATEGLRRAVVEHIADKSVNVKGDVNVEPMGKMYDRLLPSLKQVFDESELKNLKAVIDSAAEEAIADKSTRTRAGDQGTEVKQAVKSVWNVFVRKMGYGIFAGAAGTAAVAGEAMAMHTIMGGAAGAGIGIVAAQLAHMRMNNAKDVMVEMMLDPKMAHLWMTKVKSEPDRAWGESFARKLRALGANQLIDKSVPRGVDKGLEGADTLATAVRAPGYNDERPPYVESFDTGESKDTGIRPPGKYPDQSDVDMAREFDQAYGSSNARFFESEGGELRQLAAKLAPYVINNDKFDDLPWKKVDAKVADQLYLASIAANRSAIASLGFDPRRFVVTPPEKKFTAGGAYSPDSDNIWVNDQGHNNSTFVHESIHRGLEMMRRSGVIGKNDLMADDEEILVRTMMIKMFGDVEMGRGEVGDKEINRAKYNMDDKPTSRKWMAIVDGIEKKAANYIAQKGGPR